MAAMSDAKGATDTLDHSGHHPTLLGKTGMAGLIAVESSFLATFAVVYLYYIGKSINGPKPEDVLEVPILGSIVLLEGLAASAGLILVRYPCIRLLFEHGHVTSHDTELIARSLLWYATAIWAFSLLQIVNRAYYALHDTTTPLVMSIVNIVLNLVVELPLLWIPAFGEAGMAVGTSVSFTLQAIVMLWMLDRRVGGIGLGALVSPVMKMLIAMLLMIAACIAARYVPGYPSGSSRLASAGQLAIQVTVGAIVYCGACSLMGVEVLDQIIPKRLRRRTRAPLPGREGLGEG
jgi:putative peptidoglycan lipid II flippase